MTKTENDMHHVVAVLAVNHQEMTSRCLDRIRNSGFGGTILVIDNGSSPEISFPEDLGVVIQRNDKNKFVNPVWNDLIASVEANFLSLINNDILVPDKYLESVPGIMLEHGLSVCAPQIIETDGSEYFDWDSRYSLDLNACREGQVMTLDLKSLRTAGCFIPENLKVWFGDDWIWGLMRRSGYHCASLIGPKASGPQSVTLFSSPFFIDVVRLDISCAVDHAEFRELIKYARSEHHWSHLLE